MAKQRLDILLVEKNLAPSRERAKTTIMKSGRCTRRLSILADYRIRITIPQPATWH